jgi:uncharacterized GH25 family protein
MKKQLAAWLLAATLLPAAAHDSWLVPAAGGGFTLATGNRYPRADSSVPVSPKCAAGSCWIEVQPHEVALTPALVDVYFRDIRPDDAVREAWASQLERGEAWQERYVKFARIEMADAKAGVRKPVGVELEIVVDGDAPLRVGGEARFRVLSAGQPVQGLMVELVSERSALGVWARSDAEGRVQWKLPFAGAWLVRATRLHKDGMQWRSRFATLAFAIP